VTFQVNKLAGLQIPTTWRLELLNFTTAVPFTVCGANLALSIARNTLDCPEAFPFCNSELIHFSFAPSFFHSRRA
jgi:hypothetical protein